MDKKLDLEPQPITDPLSQLPKQKKKRKGNANKNKGKTGERCAAEILTEILGHPFQRIYTSGASVGRSNSYRLEQLTKGQAFAQLGDVMPPEYMRSQFVTESKNYAELEFHQLLTPKGCTQVKEWFEELAYDCESAVTLMQGKSLQNRKPVIGFLFVKITRKGEWCVFDTGMMGAAIGEYCIPDPYLQYIHPVKTRDVLDSCGWSGVHIMCGFEAFVKANREKLARVNDEEYAVYLSGGPKKLEDASVEDLERMLEAKRSARL